MVVYIEDWLDVNIPSYRLQLSLIDTYQATRSGVN